MTGTAEKLNEAAAALDTAASEIHAAENRAETAEAVAEMAIADIDRAHEIAADVVKAAAETAIVARLDAIERRQTEKWQENQAVHSELRTALAEIRTELTTLAATVSKPLTPPPSAPAPAPAPLTPPINPQAVLPKNPGSGEVGRRESRAPLNHPVIGAKARARFL